MLASSTRRLSATPQARTSPSEVERQGDVVVTSRWIRDAEPVGFFKAFGNFQTNVDRWHYYYLHPPCTSVIDFGSSSELGA